jgi:hypothetical protein
MIVKSGRVLVGRYKHNSLFSGRFLGRSILQHNTNHDGKVTAKNVIATDFQEIYQASVSN